MAHHFMNLQIIYFYSLFFHCEYGVDFIQHRIKIELKWYFFFSYLEQWKTNFHKIKMRKYHQQ